jgi:hypothetical protein
VDVNQPAHDAARPPVEALADFGGLRGPVLGDVYTRLLVGLLATDFVSKLIAKLVVPRGEADPHALLQLVLRPNAGLGTDMRNSYRLQGGPQMLLGIGVAMLATGIFLNLTRHSTMTSRRRVLLNVGVFLTTLVTGSLVACRFDGIPIPALRLLLRPSGIFFWLTLWTLLPPGLWKVAVTFWAASVLGNGLSDIFPPFGVVTDFIESTALPIGTFNLADAYAHIGKWLFVVAAAVGLLRRVNPRLI